MAAPPPSPTPGPPGPSPQPQPPGQRRRDFLELPVRLAAAAIAGAASAALRDEAKEPLPDTKPDAANPQSEQTRVIDLTGGPSAEAFEGGELSYNWIHSYIECFALLYSSQIAFLDQNGRIIDEDFIHIPEELLVLHGAPGFKDEFQKWLDGVREKIRQKYPTIYYNADQDEPTLVNVRTIFPENKIETDKVFMDVVWEKCKRSVSATNKKSRYQFLKEKLAGSGLPQGLQMIALGLVGIESKYTDMEPNSVGAAGAFQIMPDEAKQARPSLIGVRRIEKTIMIRKGRRKIKKQSIKFVPFDDRFDFEKASKRFIELYAERYRLVKNNQYVQELQKRFGLSENDIVYPLILNTYHSGVGRNVTGYKAKNGKRYVGMCKWFLDNFPARQAVEPILGKGPYGEDIFNLMVTLYAQNAVDPNFKKASRSYYRKARAMAELLRMKEIEKANPKDISKIVEFAADDDRPYAPPAPPKTVQIVAMQPVPQVEGKIAIDGTRASIALLAGAAGHVVAEEFRNPEPTTRRTHLKKLARAGATLLTAAGGVAFGSRLAKKTVEKVPPLPREIDIMYKLIPNLDESSVRAAIHEELQKTGGIAPKAKPDDLKPLDTSVILLNLQDPLSRGLEVAEKNGLEAFTAKDEIKRGKNMVPVPLQVPFLRLRSVGIADDTKIRDEDPVSQQNNPDFAYCRDFAFETIKEIALELNKKLIVDYGMPERFRIRLVGISLSRSREFHKKVQRGHRRFAAKGDSPHVYGHTFDLSRFRYDIIDTKTDQYCRINVDSPLESVENKFSLVRTINAVLARILIEMRQKGKILVIHEGPNPVYHISAIPPTAQKNPDFGATPD